jgi:hypothetical protein
VIKLSGEAQEMLIAISRDCGAHKSHLDQDVLEELSRAGLVTHEEYEAFTFITLTDEGNRNAVALLNGESAG